MLTTRRTCTYRAGTTCLRPTRASPVVEQRFEFIARVLPVPVSQAALVIVDAWSTHYIDTWLAGQRRSPRRGSCRCPGGAGDRVTIIHAPSPYIVE